ncbi:hypothetical protein Tco_1273014 [Tanacetum coccineum]
MVLYQSPQYTRSKSGSASRRTAEEILARERERKARTTLLMALLEDHLAKFHKMTDAKEMWDAIKSNLSHPEEEENYALMACNSSGSDTELRKNEVLQSVFMSKESDFENPPLYDRFVTAGGIHAVPPPMIGNYMPYGPDIEIDYSKFTYGPKQTQPSESETQTSDIDTCESNINSEDEYVSLPTKEQETPSFANQQVKSPRETVKNHFTHSKNPKVDKKELGYGFTARACFVCGSLNHLIRDCDFHEKRMAKQAVLNNRMKRNSINTARASGTKNVSTARHSFNRQAVLTSTAMKVNTVKPIVNRLVLLGGKRETAAKPSAGCNWRPQRHHYWQNVSKYNGGSRLSTRAIQNIGIVDMDVLGT